MSDTRNRSVSLPVDALEQFKELAAARNMSLSAWLVEAGRRQWARESAEAFARFVADPEVKREQAAWIETTRPWREARRRRLAELGEAA